MGMLRIANRVKGSTAGSKAQGSCLARRRPTLAAARRRRCGIRDGRSRRPTPSCSGDEAGTGRDRFVQLRDRKCGRGASIASDAEPFELRQELPAHHLDRPARRPRPTAPGRGESTARSRLSTTSRISASTSRRARSTSFEISRRRPQPRFLELARRLAVPARCIPGPACPSRRPAARAPRRSVGFSDAEVASRSAVAFGIGRPTSGDRRP